MKTNITTDQVLKWIDKRSKDVAASNPLTSHMADEPAYQLGIALALIADIANDADCRKRFIKEASL